MLTARPDGWMATLGARITEAEPGRVVLELIAGPQHRHGGGVVQGGVITQIADAAMGMSLATLQPDGTWNTTIELKINFVRPAIASSRARPLHVCRCRRGRAVSKAVISRAWSWLGLVDVAQEEGLAVVDMTPTEDMTNSAGFVHGGMI